jgi:hypothetical protein
MSGEHSEEEKSIPSEGKAGLPIRKASEGTMEMAELIQEQLREGNASEQPNPDYDEEEYNNLSSGVYEVSRTSSAAEEA